MNKVKINGRQYEWQWTQRHKCGHTTEQRVMGGPSPDVAVLRGKPCPACELQALMSDYYSKEKA